MANKVKKIVNEKGQLLGYSHYCFGCKHLHVYWTTKKSQYHYLWKFVNNDMERPTFKPSMLVNPNNDPSYPRCHYFVINGKIQYLSDCTHKFKGQTVEMKDVKS